MIIEELSQEIVVEDVDTDDDEEILYVLEEARDVAADVRADVDIQILRSGDGTVILEATGHFEDMGPFIRKWNELY